MTRNDKRMIGVMFNFLVKLWFVRAGAHRVTIESLAEEWNGIQDKLMEWVTK